MTTWAVGMVRDEADIIGYTIRHILGQVDRVLIADNLSTDGTRAILDELAADDARLTVIDDVDPAYYQSRKMTALAAAAAAAGAKWVLPMDADEVWYSPHGRIADVLADLGPEAAVAAADVFDHVATGSDSTDENPLDRMAWRRREPCELPKVACRPMLPARIEQGNHAASFPWVTINELLVVRHFPYRSAEQMIRKAHNGAAAYAATDLPEHEGKHWRDYGALADAHGDEALAGVFAQWFWTSDPGQDPMLIFDPLSACRA